MYKQIIIVRKDLPMSAEIIDQISRKYQLYK